MQVDQSNRPAKRCGGGDRNLDGADLARGDALLDALAHAHEGLRRAHRRLVRQELAMARLEHEAHGARLLRRRLKQEGDNAVAARPAILLALHDLAQPGIHALQQIVVERLGQRLLVAEVVVDGTDRDIRLSTDVVDDVLK